MTTNIWAAAATGFGTGLTLIVAIGAQNAFVLRQSIRRHHVLPIIAVCAISDAILITAGVAGMGAVVDAAPLAMTILRYAGAAFLLVYGLLSLRRAWKASDESLVLTVDDPEPARAIESASVARQPIPALVGGGGGVDPASADHPVSSPAGAKPPAARPGSGARPALAATLAACLAFTWLNPHTYVDTFLMLGSVANSHPDPDRWFLGAGAILASLTWFLALGFGARLLRPVFAKPKAWRVLDTGIGVLMFVLAGTLLTG